MLDRMQKWNSVIYVGKRVSFAFDQKGQVNKMNRWIQHENISLRSRENMQQSVVLYFPCAHGFKIIT